MAQKNLSFKKRQRFLELIGDIPPEKILFCPIDISKHFHIAIFHDINCQPLSDYVEFSASRIGFESLITRLEQMICSISPQLIVIGMEPSNIYYETLLHSLHQRYSSSLSPKFELGLVNPATVKENRKQQSLRFQKNDYIDTAAIGDLLTRGLYNQAHISSPQCIQIKELSRSINDYRQQYLSLFNRMLSTLERVFPNLFIDYEDESPLCKNPLRSTLLDDLLHICPDPYTILELTNKDLIDLFHQQGRPLGQKKALKIAQVAKRALLLPKPYQQIHKQTLTHQLETLDFLKKQIEALSKQIYHLLHLTPVRHLLSIKGNSELLTADFIAALEDWDRYQSVQQVWAAAGLAPTENQSGRHRAHPHVSCDGSVYLRNAIYKMTSSIVWHEPIFGIPCFQRLLNSYPFVPTILHVGRKLTNTALAILKSDTPFQPPLENYSQAKTTLQQLQNLYQQKKKKEAS
jgi:transposase